ncbi:endosomal P24B protein [Trypanosoma rangeli]|uniref:Endosomal P24B protein n=1 Tax=Trypanosoma rangeli TaxID=5698 RepID=A0A3R7KJS3_TRYRA|nr:endosomal P24B protein [Trypanosoma rangeli]RNF07878.1 endosomal P24B protein [Trypanosoma rangeli]|eukprot:RNF07878.1 endosomal P24B protein [Trypanosoma rangeli]
MACRRESLLHPAPHPLLLLCLATAVLLLTAGFLGADAASTTIGSGEKLCLKEVVPPQSRVTFQFQVISGGNRDIRASVADQDGKFLKEWTETTEGIYEALAQGGTKAIVACLDNTYAHYTPKLVVFHFRYHVDYTSVAKEEELDPVEKKVEHISTTMRQAEALQMHLRAQQKEHRTTVEESNQRLLVWSVLQVLALVVMSVFQLYFLKRFLERKSFL